MQGNGTGEAFFVDDAGDTAPAAALSVLNVLANIGVRVVYEGLARGIKRRSLSWARG
ncbi:MAG: hypothetical protein MUD16_11810 [Desulfobacterales bacterium]|jgi:iron(III) transport system permease protein|nr:hypothetical protein [Desulfobacterales bacterium]